MSASIEDLAWKLVNKHPNDKSGYVLSLMRRRFSEIQILRAVTNAYQLLKMVDPDHPSLPKSTSYAVMDMFYKG